MADGRKGWGLSRANLFRKMKKEKSTRLKSVRTAWRRLTARSSEESNQDKAESPVEDSQRTSIDFAGAGDRSMSSFDGALESDVADAADGNQGTDHPISSSQNEMDVTSQRRCAEDEQRRANMGLTGGADPSVSSLESDVADEGSEHQKYDLPMLYDSNESEIHHDLGSEDSAEEQSGGGAGGGSYGGGGSDGEGEGGRCGGGGYSAGVGGIDGDSSSESSDSGPESDNLGSEPDENLLDRCHEGQLSLGGDKLSDFFMAVRGGCTVREALALLLAVTVRHNLSYECILHIATIINAMFGSNYLPTNKKPLWRLLGRKSNFMTKYMYCDFCLRLLGKQDSLDGEITCICGSTVEKRKATYFAYLGLSSQLAHFLETSSAEVLNYKETRVKRSPAATEDIFDGTAYRRFDEEGSFFTYTFNTDGFVLAGSSKASAWPLFVRLHEIPPHARQASVFLVGLWIDRRQPPMNIFLKPFVEEANKLSSKGLSWKRDHQTKITKFFPLCCSADSKARCALLNFTQPTGNCGCSFCVHAGVFVDGCVRFPLPGTVLNLPANDMGGVRQITVPEYALRTAESIKEAMVEASTIGKKKDGFKGVSALINLSSFDLAEGFSTDDLHPIYKGVVEWHTELCTTDPSKEYYFGSPAAVDCINRRMSLIQTPTKISRKPRPFSERDQWTGTEGRNWLLYYAPFCLRGLIPAKFIRHLSLLGNAVFILSRDIIEEDDFQKAERNIKEYMRLFQEYFGPARMRFNVHMLEHLVPCARLLGPLWGHTTFHFESWNHQLMQKVTSPKGRIDQIVNRYLMAHCVSNIPLESKISEEIKAKVHYIMHGTNRNRSVRIDGGFMIGEGSLRDLNDEEKRLLTDGSFAADRVLVFQRVELRNMDIRSVECPHGRSLDSVIYTYDDTFGQVLSICLVSCRETGEQKCGMFVSVYEVGDCLLNAEHIVEVKQENFAKEFVDSSRIRNQVSVLSDGHQKYLVPMANQWEID